MARTMSPDEYQEVGRRYYMQEQYEKAIEAFTEGIDAAKYQSMSLFDHRAAGYDKLAKFTLALKDGRSMIKLNKQNVKGYLRTGSVLEKMEKLETAAAIYKHGIKNVPTTDSHFSILQQLHDRTTRKLYPASAVDPLAVLPPELVEMVISYLPFKDMVRCMRVSKGWKRYIVAEPAHWTDLDFTGARRPVSKAFIRDAVSRSQKRVDRITIHRIADANIMVNVATVCKDITNLEFVSGGATSRTFIDIARCAITLKKLEIHMDISLDTATEILRWRPTLEHIVLRSIVKASANAIWQGTFPNLHTLHVNGDKRLDAQNLRNLSTALILLLDKTPVIQSLNYSNCLMGASLPFSRIPLLKELVLKTQHLGDLGFPHLPPSLRKLSLHPKIQFNLPSGPNGDNWMHTSSWETSGITDLPHLTHLNLANFSNVNAAFLTRLLDEYHQLEDDGSNIPLHASERPPVSTLEHFSLTDSHSHTAVSNYFGPGGLLTSSPRILSSSLFSLNLATLPCDDDDIEAMLTHHNGLGLQNLNLSQTNISGASVKMLVGKLPNLKYLNLNECHKISSRDAIHYAKKKGVSVTCQMGELKSGKRVRYD